MAIYEYTVKGRRFVRQVQSAIPTPSTGSLAEASAVFGRLQENGAWREIADINVRASLPATGSEKTDGNLANMDFFDAYAFCAGHSDGRHTLYMGSGCYRMSFPQSMVGAALKSIRAALFGDPFLAEGARMVVRASDSPAPDPAWADVFNGGAQISGAVKRTEIPDPTPSCPQCVTWRGFSANYTLDKDETKGDGSVAVFPAGGITLQRFLYVYVSLENYRRTRNGWVEGSAMSGGVFGLSVEGSGLPPSGELEEEPAAGIPAEVPVPQGFSGWFDGTSLFEAEMQNTNPSTPKTWPFSLFQWGDGSGRWSAGGSPPAFWVVFNTTPPEGVTSRIVFRWHGQWEAWSDRIFLDVITGSGDNGSRFAVRVTSVLGEQYGKITVPAPLPPDLPVIPQPAPPQQRLVIYTDEALFTGRGADCTTDVLPADTVWTELAVTRVRVRGLNAAKTTRDYERVAQQLLMWHGRSKRHGDGTNICTGEGLSGPTGIILWQHPHAIMPKPPANFGLMAFVTPIGDTMDGGQVVYSEGAYVTSYIAGWLPTKDVFSKVIIEDITGTTVPAGIRCRITPWFLPRGSLASTQVGADIRAKYMLTPEFWTGEAQAIGSLARLARPVILPETIPARMVIEADAPFSDGALVITASLASPDITAAVRGFKQPGGYTPFGFLPEPDDPATRWRQFGNIHSVPAAGWTPSVYVE